LESPKSKASNLNQLEVYPNPATGVLNVSLFAKSSTDILLSISDSKGKKIHSEKMTVDGLYTRVFQMKDFEKGIYIVSVRHNGESARTRKVVIY
jgi:hypothetical protein